MAFTRSYRVVVTSISLGSPTLGYTAKINGVSLTTMVLTNFSGFTEIVSVYVSKTGEALTDVHTLIKNKEILAGESFLWETQNNYYLIRGDSVYFVASTGGRVTAHLCVRA